jgi:hypothetical protein
VEAERLAWGERRYASPVPPVTTADEDEVLMAGLPENSEGSDFLPAVDVQPNLN